MYAIVDVKDKQFKVREDDTLYVPYHSDANADQELTLDRVLLVSDGEGDVTVGTPTVEDASVTARVLEHVKGDKVIVFKKKRRKRYRVKRGHRQQYTQIQIESLNLNGASENIESESVEESTSGEDVVDEAETAEDDAPTDEADETSVTEESEDTAESEKSEETPESEEDEEPKAESD
jgi:large subunit ribosomal protein L21